MCAAARSMHEADMDRSSSIGGTSDMLQRLLQAEDNGELKAEEHNSAEVRCSCGWCHTLLKLLRQI